ncbi:MAG: ABC transporter permease [Tissierellia bacterium]|nr:ABC transporter permease [Tissierellia bacterium]
MSEKMAENKIIKKRKKNSPMSDVWRKLKKNKLAMISLFIICLLIIISIFAPLLVPYDYTEQDYDNMLQAPNSRYIFGTDNFGRDVFSRVIYGSRYTVFIGFVCITVAAIIGVLLGLIAAYYPKLDNLIMRTIDIIIGMPAMTLLMCLIAVMGVSLTNMIIALCITTIPGFARVTRAQVLVVKNQEFIEAAIAIGADTKRILFRHILPNSLAPIIVQYTLGAGTVVLLSASLSFIGMGVQAPNPEWGLMISSGRPYLRSNWYLSIIPGFAIILLTFTLNYLGDGLRDALDPKLNK